MLDHTFINKLAALVITSLILVIGLVLLKTASLPDVTTPDHNGHQLTIYEKTIM